MKLNDIYITYFSRLQSLDETAFLDGYRAAAAELLSRFPKKYLLADTSELSDTIIAAEEAQSAESSDAVSAYAASNEDDAIFGLGMADECPFYSEFIPVLADGISAFIGVGDRSVFLSGADTAYRTSWRRCVRAALQRKNAEK